SPRRLPAGRRIGAGSPVRGPRTPVDRCQNGPDRTCSAPFHGLFDARRSKSTVTLYTDLAGRPRISTVALYSPATDFACTIARLLKNAVTSLLLDGIQKQSHRPGERLPCGLFGKELFPAEGREAIVPGPLPFIGPLPAPRRRLSVARFAIRPRRHAFDSRPLLRSCYFARPL